MEVICCWTNKWCTLRIFKPRAPSAGTPIHCSVLFYLGSDVKGAGFTHEVQFSHQVECCTACENSSDRVMSSVALGEVVKSEKTMF